MVDEGKQADPQASKEFWLQTVTPLARRGGLDKLPTRKASTPREAETARLQNQLLSRRTYSMPDLSHIRGMRGNA